MGTLIRPEQALEAKEAGAWYIVRPVCNPKLSQAMVASGLAVMIGAPTPTEVYQAYSLGSDDVRLFPGSLIGPAYIKALRDLFPEIPLLPTGGVSKDNVAKWFAAGVVAVRAGS
jgi:2-dehydro-3-deoxyphosphogluconate aldolase/(4S)-4-hydroxy-2-oxoglutarate aldolase